MLRESGKNIPDTLKLAYWACNNVEFTCINACLNNIIMPCASTRSVLSNWEIAVAAFVIDWLDYEAPVGLQSSVPGLAGDFLRSFLDLRSYLNSVWMNGKWGWSGYEGIVRPWRLQY